MFYRKNVGARERVIRAVGGGLVMGCSLFLLGTTPLGLLGVGSGAMMIVTGLFGFCPACAMVGREPVDGPR